MTVQGEAPADEPVDPSAMYSGLSMADDRINQLQSESGKMRYTNFRKYVPRPTHQLGNGANRIRLE